MRSTIIQDIRLMKHGLNGWTATGQYTSHALNDKVTDRVCYRALLQLEAEGVIESLGNPKKHWRTSALGRRLLGVEQ